MKWVEILSSGIIVAMFTSAVLLVVENIKDKQSKKELYAQTVSSFRMGWMREIRIYLVRLIVLCKTIKNCEDDNKKLERYRANILMRLQSNNSVNKKSKKLSEEWERLLTENTKLEEEIEKMLKENYEYDELLEALLKVMTFEQIREKGYRIGNAIVRIGTKLLKKEWERVKAEAGETVEKYEEIKLRTDEMALYKK